MAITTMDGLVSAMASAQYVDTEEASMTSKAAGQFQSLWTAGGRPGAGAAPGSAGGIANTSSTTGAIPFSNPGGSNTLYLARLEISGATAGSIILYDRLVSTSTLSGIVATSQTISSTALTRSTTGTNVGLWIEWYSATGSTATTATFSYTNQAGTSGQSTSVAFPASPVAGQMIPVPLAAGDTGVRAVASCTLSATTGTAGNFGITLASRVATVPIPVANIGQLYDYAQVGLPVISSNACLAYKVLCSATNTGLLVSGLTLAQG